MIKEENGATTESVKLPQVSDSKSATRLPQAGEWWSTRDSEIVFVAFNARSIFPNDEDAYPLLGYISEGYIQSYTLEGVYSSSSERSKDLVKHLPDCTGFDWVEPVPQPTTPDRVPVSLYLYVNAFNKGYDTVIRAKIDYTGSSIKPLKWCPDIGFYYESNQ